MPKVTHRRWFRTTVLGMTTAIGLIGLVFAVTITPLHEDQVPTWYLCGWVAFAIASFIFGAWIGPKQSDIIPNPTTGLFAGMFACGALGVLVGVLWPFFSWVAIFYTFGIFVLVPWVDRGTPPRKG